MAFQNFTQCNATAKSTGERCSNPAVTGSTKCRMHGGTQPRGIASQNYKHGRYSKYSVAPIVAKIQEAAQDPELLSLRDEIALQTHLIGEKLKHIDTGESGVAWQQAKQLVKQARKGYKSESYAVLEDALDSLEDLADGRILHYATEKEIREGMEQRRKLVESERKRLIDMEQMITAEQAMTIIQRLLQSVKENVKDRDTLNAIQQEFILATQSAHYHNLSERAE